MKKLRKISVGTLVQAVYKRIRVPPIRNALVMLFLWISFFVYFRYANITGRDKVGSKQVGRGLFTYRRRDLFST